MTENECLETCTGPHKKHKPGVPDICQCARCAGVYCRGAQAKRKKDTAYRKILPAQMYNVARNVETVVAEPISISTGSGVGEKVLRLSLTCGAQISVDLPREDARALAAFILQQTEED